MMPFSLPIGPRLGRVTLLAAVVGLVAACEASIDPILKTDRLYTLYGTLSSSADTQTVRVYPIGERLEATPGERLGAAFTSENLETGTVRTWKDSVHTEPDGQRVHVFWSPFTVDRGSSYRLEVSDGRRGTTSVDLTVPPFVEPEPEPAEIAPGSVVKPIRIPAAAPEVASPVTVIYLHKFDMHDPRQGVTYPSTVGEMRLEAPVVQDGDEWVVEIPLDEHFDRLDQLYATQRRLDEQYGIYLFGLEIEFQVVSEGWTIPGREMTPELVVEPGVRTNVENGFGFVGAGYSQRRFIPTSKENEVEAGFRETVD